MKDINHMILKFPSMPANEMPARMAVTRFAAQLNPTVLELGDIGTAVSEAITNCIVHAYPEEPGIITLCCRILKDNVLDIVIKDCGIGILDVKDAMRPMYTTSTEHTGMGFTIIESFMDRLSISSEPGKGTRVHMRRKCVGNKKDE